MNDGWRVCRTCERSLPTRDFSGAQLTRYPRAPRCRDCVAGRLPRFSDGDDDDDDNESHSGSNGGSASEDGDGDEFIVAQCQVCTMVKSTADMTQSTISQMHLCSLCAAHNDWCCVCEQLLDEEYFSSSAWQRRAPRVCLECEPVALDRVNLTECSACRMRLGQADFDGSSRVCRSCSRRAPASSAVAASSASAPGGGDRSEHLCIVCLQNERDATYQCWHLAVCQACASKLDGCPICRSKCDFIPLSRV